VHLSSTGSSTQSRTKRKKVSIDDQQTDTSTDEEDDRALEIAARLENFKKSIINTKF